MSRMQTKKGQSFPRWVFRTLAVGVLLAFGVHACTAPVELTRTPITAPADPLHLETVRAHIEQLVAEGEVPSMAVAVARDGEIIWEEGFGLADRERKIPPPNIPRTPWPRSPSRSPPPG